MPLIDRLRISHFYHYLLTDAGGFSSVGLNQQWHDCVFSGNDCCIPALRYFRHRKHEPKKIIFTQAFENDSWQNLVKIAKEEFSVHLGLQISIETEEGQEAFGFGLKSSDPFEHLAFLNELSFINLFLQAYRREFSNCVLKENLVDISSLIEPSLDKKSRSEKKISELLSIYREAPNPFTKREAEVITYLLEGYSASAIADKLFLSKRTIEHHLERMKEKMDCLSKLELIQKVRRMESLGYKL